MSKLDWIVLVICLGMACPKSELGNPIFARIEQAFGEFSRKKRLTVVAVGVAAILTRLALLPWLPIPEPKVHDEFSYLLAADTFAHGRLANPPHPLWVFFDTFHVIQHPTYASMYPPGQGMALAAGEILGQPWIGALLSVAAMCMAFAWMFQGWVPPEWALLGGVLVWVRFGIFSYWINSYWGGAVAATGAALVLGALPRIWESKQTRDAIILGLGAAILAVSRPVEGFIFFLPLGIAILIWVLRNDAAARGLAVRRILLPIASILVCAGGLVGYYNWRVTGSPAVFPHFIEQKMITTAIFLWQHDKPPIHYANPQFDDFYHNFLPSLYQPGWAEARGQLWYKADDFWEFFLGPALSIPFLALPWLLKEGRNRLLFLQIMLSAIGLWIVVYYHAHYAAPLMASAFVLLIQGMQCIGRVRLFGRPVGAAFARIIILFCLLVGPVYFAQAEFPRAAALFEWLVRHALGVLAAAAFALVLLRLVRAGSFRKGTHPAWPETLVEFILVVGIVFQICVIQRSFYPDDLPYVDDLKEPFRRPVEGQLEAIPGQHLVIVRYSKDHNSGEEYVYNDADIDHAKIVWAREIPGMDLSPLFSYFRNRDVWLYEPDQDDSVVSPYADSGRTDLAPSQ